MNPLLKTPSADKWKRIGAARRAGLVAPLFMLHSASSAGVGDFNDLRLAVDLCVKAGRSILQLLPMNEVGATFCPYDAISSFALEPMYISLDQIPCAGRKAFRNNIDTLKRDFADDGAHVDYRVKDKKIGLLRDAYQEDKGRDSREFEKFAEDNAYWIGDFALYKVIKDHEGGRPWYEWEDGFKGRDPAVLDAFAGEHEDELEFQAWLQWIAYKQFVGVKRYAGTRKVLVMGDLPILISKDSADVWAHPEFFKLGYAAGAPADMYCAMGQRWGMPTYDWETIAEDGYAYLKKRLECAESFYDILRIDHVVGLFRIWSIPAGEPAEKKALNGFFDPPDENLWHEHGRRILSVMLESTSMLLAAEDLGIIPKVCPEALEEFGIPGNDVQRWAKDWEVRHDFLDPGKYRSIATAMLSTHDTTNWAAWWENETGTVDEELFMRKCAESGIDYGRVRDILFDRKLSRRGRLRWNVGISSCDILTEILGRKKEEAALFLKLYENSYMEKEKLWKRMKLKGPMRERCDSAIALAALKIPAESASIFSIELLTDLLYPGGILKGDPYEYRINTPGTVDAKNWSLRIPVTMEELLKHGVLKEIRAIAVSSRRI